ncbi:MAG: hypothetical protein WA136_05845, partial [Rhodoferax sp.]
MSLRDTKSSSGTHLGSEIWEGTRPREISEYYKLKAKLHQDLIGRVDLEVLGNMPPDRLREELAGLVEKMLDASGVALNSADRKRMVLDIQNEVMGLGPLEPLLADTTVSGVRQQGLQRPQSHDLVLDVQNHALAVCRVEGHTGG